MAAAPHFPGAAAALLLALGACAQGADRDMSDNEVAAELAHMRITPGLWELKSAVVEVRGPELPREVRNRMIGPRPTLRNCLTPAQAARPSANFLAARTDTSCRYRGFSIRDGQMRGEMRCRDTQARMTGRYEPERYDFDMELEGPAPGGETMTLSVRASGRRLGACERGEGT